MLRACCELGKLCGVFTWSWEEIERCCGHVERCSGHVERCWGHVMLSACWEMLRACCEMLRAGWEMFRACWEMLLRECWELLRIVGSWRQRECWCAAGWFNIFLSLVAGFFSWASLGIVGECCCYCMFPRIPRHQNKHPINHKEFQLATLIVLKGYLQFTNIVQTWLSDNAATTSLTHACHHRSPTDLDLSRARDRKRLCWETDKTELNLTVTWKHIQWP